MAQENQTNIKETVQETAQDAQVAVKKRLPDFMKKRPFIIGMAVVVIVIVSMIVISVNKKNPGGGMSQVPGGTDLLLATVGGREIHQSDVQKTAELDYPKEDISQDL